MYHHELTAHHHPHSAQVDMTTGPIVSAVMLFALPIILGDVLQQLYTTVDTLVIGRYCDTTALAAVGTSTQPVEVVLCVFLGIGKGVSILVSQCIGAKNEKRVGQLCKASVFFVYACGIPVGVLGILCAPAILRFMQTPADTFAQAVAYTRIVFCGTLGNIGYNMNAGILRGMGDSRASLWFLLVSCITNIVLDFAFVAGLHMGVGGVALATSIAMLLSWGISIAYIRKKFPQLGFSVLPHRCAPQELEKIIVLGLPIGLNSSLFSFGHLAMQTFINAQGAVFMAATSVGGRVTNLTNVAVNALSSAALTFAGQNFGAGCRERLRRGAVSIPLASGAITLLCGLLMLRFRLSLLRLFDQDPDVLFYAQRYVLVLLLSQWVFAVFNAMVSCVNGVGRVKYTTAVNLLMLWAVRIPGAWLISRWMDGTWVMLSIPASFCFGLACMIGYYLASPGWKRLLRGSACREARHAAKEGLG